MKRIALTVCALAIGTVAARADFDRWSVKTEDDPFTGGKRLVADYMESIRSGTFIFCDTAKSGIEIRSIAGFEFTPDLGLLSPQMEFAVDGTRIFAATGYVGAVGSNITATSAAVDKEDALKFLTAFAVAKKQIAIKDGVSDRPSLLKASGSTKVGQALLDCLKKQGGSESASEGISTEQEEFTEKAITIDDAIELLESKKGELSDQQRVRLGALGSGETAAAGPVDDIKQQMNAALEQLKAEAANMTPEQKAQVVIVARTHAEATAREMPGSTESTIKTAGDMAEAQVKSALGM